LTLECVAEGKMKSELLVDAKAAPLDRHEIEQR
jgi:hypothetical protein